MNFKPVVLGLVAAACIAVGAVATFVAMRPDMPAQPVAAAVEATAQSAGNAAQPVTETEALVSQPSSPETPEASASPARAEAPDAGRSAAPVTPRQAPRRPAPVRAAAPAPRPATVTPDSPARPASTARAADPAPPAISAPSRETGSPAAATSIPDVRTPAYEPLRTPEAPRTPQGPSYVEVVVPASAVIGLQVDRALSSETARVEDRVEARVTRDVMAAGQRAIPAGSRMVGSVVLVERGGKMKDPARLGVRFHTLVLGDGTEVPLRTEAIFRDGDSPGHESSRKIGGAAVGGAILGAILGGGKGAVLGGATGAAGGTAAVMVGGRNAATLPAGAIVTARLSDPVTIQVEKE